MQCKKCLQETEIEILKKKKYICPYCGNYFRIPAIDRISMVADKGTFEEWFQDVRDANPLDTEGYEEKIKKARENTGISEAVITGKAKIFGQDIALGVCDASFLMGSMGYVVGERVTRLIEKATEERLPLFIFCCSGGARMQEGIISLMQMEKTAAAIGRHSEAGLFYCSVLTDPTTGGVTASFAMLGDIIIAEPNALVGFAGQRVIKQTIGEDLPKGFQLSEFQQQHGFIDGIVERKRLKHVMLYFVLSNRGDRKNYYIDDKKYNLFKQFKAEISKGRGVKKKSAWEKVKEIRTSSYPSNSVYVDNIFDAFVELKGDRYFGDDAAVNGGIAFLGGKAVTVIAISRGKNVEEFLERHYGMPMPEGYRKSLRLMKQAEKFNRPIITFVNTMGAYCGIGAEERGQGEAIARNLMEMSRIGVPILTIITGEAGSGGALALAVANQVWMFENATYSVLTPEGYASILWKDSSRASDAAELMKITADDLKRLGIIEKIIPDFNEMPSDAVHDVSNYLRKEITKFIESMNDKSKEAILEDRYRRYRTL